MCVLSRKVSIRKKSGNLYAPRIFEYNVDRFILLPTKREFKIFFFNFSIKLFYGVNIIIYKY